MLYRFLSLWFRLCSALGAPLGSVLAAPFFRSCVPSCWVWVGSLLRGRWVRRWASRSCGRPSASSGFVGRWVCLPASSLPALRLSCFVWAVAPAVVSRRGGFVFSVWAFVSPAPSSSLAPAGAGAAAPAAAPALAVAI